MFSKGHGVPSSSLGGSGSLFPSYVRVLFDYGYIDQAKKHVLMRENEVLLLLSKTNGDWWQVIRRGERRPFYAPAKYVHELSPSLTESQPSVVDSRYIKPVTTFGFPSSKRCSYAHPSGASSSSHPPSTGGGLHPRYRSNSLDSILVSESAKALLSLREIPTAQRGNFILEKRPTIEALDKRKSWSVSPGRPLMAGRHSAPVSYKKPVPLPRLKPKVTAPPHGIVSTQEAPSKGLGKRSKTDLTLEGLSAYKQRPEKPLTLSTFGRQEQQPLSRVLSESNLAADSEDATYLKKSQPLVIMTQPIKDVENGPGTGRLASSLESSEEATKSSSFDSCFDESSSLEEDSGPLSDERESSRLLGDLSPELKSPVSTTSRSPPSPSPDMTPTRSLMVEWDEYCDDKSGRKFYVNSLTKEKRWKPPRKSKSEGSSAPNSPDPESDKVNRKLDLSDGGLPDEEEEILEEDEEPEEPVALSSSTPNSLDEVDKGFPETPEIHSSIPDGYEEVSEGDNKYIVNIFTGVRWYSARDGSGKVYYYEENGNESCWTLPNVAQSIQDTQHNSSSISSESPPPPSEAPPPNKGGGSGTFLSSPNFRIGSVSILVLKQGPLNKTKIFKNGKKQRKHWVSSHVVLTDTFLLFFKDAKGFAAMQAGASGKPEHVLDLKGSTLEPSSDKTKRAHVFEVTSPLFGLCVLLQGDSQEACSEWFKEIQSVIARIHDSTLGQRDSLPPVSRVKSIKSSSKKFLGSSEDLPSSQPSANNIREKLKKFFLRRPTMEDLFRRGIIKNEPVFGSTLKELSANEASDVPLFVKKCVREIEKGDFLSSDGVYRQSGNLSTIQKIRLQVDQGNLAILETLDDVHVLTGALKLFFRELKEPLIPWDCVDDLLAVPTLPGRKARLRALKEILSKMTPPHRATLLCLLRHLDRVTEFKESNRMQIHNLAIVFGPTLMWPPPHHGASTNLALDMMQQNIIVETLLSHANSLV